MQFNVVCGFILFLTGVSSKVGVGSGNESVPGIGNFEIKKDVNSILLTWETLQFEKILFFEIERSFDNKNFIQIGLVSSIPAPHDGIFSYRDRSRLLGSKSYYRLKVKDSNGIAYGSDVLEWISGKPESLELKPNPAEDILTVKIPDPFSNGTVIIKSTKGEILFRKHLDIQQPDNYIFLASDLPAGLALVCLEQGNQIWSRLVMIYN